MEISKFYKSILLLFLSLASFGQLKAQPESYIIYNKTNCTAQVTATCTDLSSTTHTLGTGQSWSNSCSVGETLCTVKMTLPGSVIIFVADYSLLCLNSGSNMLPPSPCYTQNVQWQTISNHVVCNIY